MATREKERGERADLIEVGVAKQRLENVARDGDQALKVAMRGVDGHRVPQEGAKKRSLITIGKNNVLLKTLFLSYGISIFPIGILKINQPNTQS